MKKILNSPSLHLILLIIVGHAALASSRELVRIYRDGVPASWSVAAVHVLAVVIWGLFMWQFERLEKRLKWAQRTNETIKAAKANRVS